MDILAQKVQLCARFNGGANAGHTLYLWLGLLWGLFLVLGRFAKRDGWRRAEVLVGFEMI